MIETQQNSDLFRVSRKFHIFSVSRNDRNSAKQLPVSYSFVFRETFKKYETVNPNHNVLATLND